MTMSAATDFDTALRRFAALDEEALGRPWPFRDRPMDVRYALYRTLEDAQEVYVDVAGRPHPESRRILSLAERAFGDLRGLLVGVPVELLDKSPHQGEWPLRETLRHMLVVERRYALQTQWAIERGDSESVRIPDDRLPTPAQIDVSGEIGDILQRIGEARTETHRRLGDVAPAAMTRPTVWVHYEVDVRFRLHRFAAHLVEHTIQCEKILAALGWRSTEGRRIVRRLAAMIGEIEGLGATAEAREMKNRTAERLASVAA
jgi:DinB superfamily